MDDSFVLDLASRVSDARIYSIAPLNVRPYRETDLPLEFLIVVREVDKKHVFALLSMTGNLRCDVISAETFDGLGPPSYFYRCKAIPLAAVVASARERRRREEEETETRLAEDARLEIVIVSQDERIVGSLESAIRVLSPTAKVNVVARAENAQLHDRLDLAFIDADIPDWGAVRAIDWLMPYCPADCIGLVMSSQTQSVFNLVKNRGVRPYDRTRAADLPTLHSLLAAGHRRNRARLASLIVAGNP